MSAAKDAPGRKAWIGRGTLVDFQTPQAAGSMA